MRVVELPINSSEDRVVGTIDIEAALRSGAKRFEPGVLAEANRNILYVDEVNLLDDHLVDVLLDAAAMGVNVVEREGVSFAHPSRFILVGTMNPEEGELRPQLLDRFGLCVDVEGIRDPDERVLIAERDAAFKRGDHEFANEFAAASTQIAEIRRAWPWVTRTFFTAAIASARARERLRSAAANSFANSWSPRLKAASRSAMSTRSSGSRMPSTSTHSPKRSSSCGRSSPSSGFIVPTRMNRDGWANDTPSRSTTLTPIAAASRRTSTMWSSSRLTSSTYRMFRLASARTPGSNRLVPVRRAASMSIVPTTRSSDELMGSSTTRMRRLWEGSTPADLNLWRQSAQRASRSVGSQPK